MNTSSKPPKISKEVLARLSKEEKLQLLDAIEERKKRKREARSAFSPHAGQIDIIKSDKKIRIVTAANGSGKTALAINEVLWAALGYNPILKTHYKVPAKIYVVLDSPDKVSSVWVPEIKKWYNLQDEQLHKRGKPFYTEITFDNGSSVKFLFHEQEELVFESIEGSFFAFDEPCKKQLFVALLRAGRTKGTNPRYLLIGTPLSQYWLREYFVEWEKGMFPDTQFFKMSTQANAANLSENYIEEFSRHLTEREKATRLHGEFFSTDGMALAGLWKRDKHLVRESDLPADYKQAWPHVISVDPHPQKATYACLLAAAPNGKTYYVGETAQKIVPREFGKWLKDNWLFNHRIVDIVCDSSGQADFTGGEGFKSFIEVLVSMGIRIRATTYEEKLETDFLTRLQEGLYIPDPGEPLLQFVISQARGITHDIENVSWKPQKGTEDYQPKLEISNKDYLACLKYALAANLTFDNAKRKIFKLKTTSPWAGKGQKEGYMERAWRVTGKRFEDDDF
jgi:hypothetical protein